jgi:hypothetical protein
MHKIYKVISTILFTAVIFVALSTAAHATTFTVDSTSDCKDSADATAGITACTAEMSFRRALYQATTGANCTAGNHSILFHSALGTSPTITVTTLKQFPRINCNNITIDGGTVKPKFVQDNRPTSASGLFLVGNSTIVNNLVIKNIEVQVSFGTGTNHIFDITQANNALIDNNKITILVGSVGHAILFRTVSNSTASNNIVSHSAANTSVGVYLSNNATSANNKALNNTISGYGNGVLVPFASTGMEVKNNTISSTSSYAILFSAAATNAAIENNGISNTTTYGIYISAGGSNYSIKNNTLTNLGNNINLDGGLYVRDITGSDISYNTITNSTHYGILLSGSVTGSNNNTIHHNTIVDTIYQTSGDSAAGIRIHPGSNNTLEYNIIRGTKNRITTSGPYIAGTGISIIGLSATINTYNNIVRYNEIYDNVGDAIAPAYIHALNNTFSKNKIYGNARGIAVFNATAARNDIGDIDVNTGASATPLPNIPNNGLNAPVFSAAYNTCDKQTYLEGYIRNNAITAAGGGATLELFESSTAVNTYGQGKTYKETLVEGTVSDLTSATGDYTGTAIGSDVAAPAFKYKLASNYPVGTVFTGTATDTDGNTSSDSYTIGVIDACALDKEPSGVDVTTGSVNTLQAFSKTSGVTTLSTKTNGHIEVSCTSDNVCTVKTIEGDTFTGETSFEITYTLTGVGTSFTKTKTIKVYIKPTVQAVSQKPEGIPEIFQIDADKTSAKLYITSTAKPVTKYTIIYGEVKADSKASAQRVLSLSKDKSQDTSLLSLIKDLALSTSHFALIPPVYALDTYQEYQVETPATDGITTYTVSGLNPGSTYAFKVKAANNNSYSDYSNQLTAKLPTNGQVLSVYKDNTSQTSGNNTNQLATTGIPFTIYTIVAFLSLITVGGVLMSRKN